MEHAVRYVHTFDGHALAYSTFGEGPPVGGPSAFQVASSTIAAGLPRPGLRRRLLQFAYRHRSLQLLFLLGPPVGWFGIVYLGSLAVLFVAAFWYLDPLTSAIRHDLTLRNFQQLIDKLFTA